MSFRSVLKTLGFLLLLLIAGGSVGALYLWTQSDHLLESQVRSALADRLPGVKLEFTSIRLESLGTLRVSNVSLSTPGATTAPVQAPEVVVQLDEELMRVHRRFSLRKVTLVRPVVLFRRDEQGLWNFHQFAVPPQSDLPPPEIEILGGAVIIQAAATREWPAIQWRTTNVHASLQPAAFKQYEVALQCDAESLGPVGAVGSVDLRTWAWSIKGAASRIDAEGSLLSLASGLSPQIRERMAALADARTQMQKSRAVDIIQTASLAEGPASRAISTEPPAALGGSSPVPSATELETSSPLPFHIPSLGIAANLDVRFRAESDGLRAPTTYEVRVSVRNGQITDELVPIPLFDVQADAVLDQKGLTIKNFQAANGETRIASSGQLMLHGDRPREFTLSATNMRLDQRIREHLPPGLLKLYDKIQPEGRFNVNVTYQQSDSTPPRVQLKEFRVFDGRARHELFQYRARQCEGTIRQQDDVFVLDFHGLAEGVHPFTLSGEVRNPGPEMAAIIDIDCPELPLDHRFREAFQVEKQRGVRQALIALDLEGRGAGQIRLTRDAGPDQRFKLKLDADVSNGRINFNKFPYSVEQLSGHIRYDASATDVWHFERMTGVHKGTTLQGNAEFTVRPGGGLLELAISATDAQLDEDLQTASVTAVPGLESLWNQLSPSGKVDLRDILITWSPGTPTTIELPSIQLRDGQMTISGFPYPLERMTGAGRWNGKRLTIDTLTGWHKDAYISIDGTTGGALAFVDYLPKPNVSWRAHFDRLDVRDLPLDLDLRQALPPTLQRGYDSLSPAGTTHLALSVDMKRLADREGTITAQWRGDTTLNGITATTGIELTGVRGGLTIVNAVWDGQNIDAEGILQLTEARAFDMPLSEIRAPLRALGNQIVVGSPSFAQPAPTYRPETIEYGGSLLSAKLYGGDFNLESEVRIDPEDSDKTVYAVTTTAREVNLRDWARETRRTERIRGPLNLLCTLSGRGSSGETIVGEGWAQVVDAEMYDLPVMLQVLSVLEGKGPNDAAFNYAYGDFTLHDGIVDFSQVELMGETLSLVGQGYVGFDGPRYRAIDMDFYTRTGGALRRNMAAIPIVGTLASNLIRLGTEGWMQVEVLGTVDSPQAVPRLNNPLPDNLKRVLESGQFRPRRLPMRPPNPRTPKR